MPIAGEGVVGLRPIAWVLGVEGRSERIVRRAGAPEALEGEITPCRPEFVILRARPRPRVGLYIFGRQKRSPPASPVLSLGARTQGSGWALGGVLAI